MSLSQDDINELSQTISENVGDEPLIVVKGFGQMTKRQAIQSTITYLKQMAETLEQGVGVPLYYFDMAKDHYVAAIGEPSHQETTPYDEMLTSDVLKSGFQAVSAGQMEHDELVEQLIEKFGGSREDAVDAIEEFARLSGEAEQNSVDERG